MFEIYILFIFIPRRVRALAKPRGQSVLAWSLIAIGSWVAAEIVVFAGIVLLMALFEDLEKSGLFMFSTWIISFLAAAGAVSLVFRRLRQMPLEQFSDATGQWN